MEYASICILAYKRPHLLPNVLRSIHDTLDFPTQIIVNLDGADEENIQYLQHELMVGRISNLIISAGNNRGVGRSFQNCLGLAEGDFIFKIDTDLIFSPQWLSTSVNILKNNIDIGAICLFDYNHYDPFDERFTPSNNHVETREDCIIVKDLVSSIYGFRGTDKNKIIPTHDDGNHFRLIGDMGEPSKLAITKKDFVKNEGFGVYKSTYVSGTEDAPFKTPTHDQPLIFKAGLKNA